LESNILIIYCCRFSILKTHEGASDMLPRFSYCKPTTHRDKMINRRHSLNLPEQLPGHCSRKATERTQKATSKSVADLVGEIAALEQEVIRKELHLLSLYRRTFDQYVSESCSFTSEVHNMRDRIRYISYMKSKCQCPNITVTSSRWTKRP